MKAKLIPHEIIEDIASKLRVEWGLSETEPINVKTILRKLNILTIYRPLSMDSCGVSLMTADKTKRFMLINSNCPRGRQHFTIAHELFHLFVDENPEPHICKESGEKDNNEKNADMFASCLLMPKRGILANCPKNEIKERNVSVATILKLEQLFGVSHQALVYRLKRLKLISETQLQDLLKANIKLLAEQYGIEKILYEPGNEGVIIGDYGTKARLLFENEKISEGHYNELMNTIGYGKN